MQMFSSDHYYSRVEKDYVSRDEYSYTQGSNIHMMKPDHSQPITYGQNHGYGHGGGYNNLEKKGHDGLVKHYSGAGYEEETHRHGWGGKDDHGGNMHYNDKIRCPQEDGMNHGGYGAVQGHNGHYKEGTNHGGYGAVQGHNGHYKEGSNHGGYGAHQGYDGHYKEGSNHGGYGAHQGYDGHYKEGSNHGGYGGYQGHNGHYKEGSSHGGYGAPQGHYGPPKAYPEMKEVSMWEIKGIDD